MCGESSAKLYSFDSWLGRPVDGFKLHEAKVAFRTVPPDKHFGGKGKRLIKGLGDWSFSLVLFVRLCTTCSGIMSVVSYYARSGGGKWQIRRSRVKGLGTRSRNLGRFGEGAMAKR